MTPSNQTTLDHPATPRGPEVEAALPVYPAATTEIPRRRKELAPATHDAFQEFSKQVFAAGALDKKTKQLIAVAAAHVTQCPYCIEAHTKAALREGASEYELMEAIWVAAEMRAGGAYAHSTLTLDAATARPAGPASRRRRSAGQPFSHQRDRPRSRRSGDRG